jgi:hypothetical protein
MKVKNKDYYQVILQVVKAINAYPEINSLNQIPKNIKKRQQEKD